MKNASLKMLATKVIGDIRAAFGPPGDYGYETKQGRALADLYDLYNTIVAQRLIAASCDDPDATIEARLAECLALAIDTPLLNVPDPERGGKSTICLRLYSFLPEVTDRAAELLEEIGL